MLKGCFRKNITKYHEQLILDFKHHFQRKMRRRYNRAAEKHKSDKTKSKEGKVYGPGAS